LQWSIKRSTASVIHTLCMKYHAYLLYEQEEALEYFKQPAGVLYSCPGEPFVHKLEASARVPNICTFSKEGKWVRSVLFEQ